jgi:hypothetical protein
VSGVDPAGVAVAAFALAAPGWRVVTLETGSRTAYSQPIAGWLVVDGDVRPLISRPSELRVQISYGDAPAWAPSGLQPLTDEPGTVGVFGPGQEPNPAAYAAARRRVRDARRAERERRRLEREHRAAELQRGDEQGDAA